MKRLSNLFVFFAILFLVSCQKNVKDILPITPNSDTALTSSKGGGSGSGGGTVPTGPLGNIGGPYRLVGGNSDSMQVSFTQDVPAAGWTLSLSSNDPSVRVPSTYFVPAGSLAVHPPVTSSAITTSKNVTITVVLNGQSKSTTFKVYPLHVSFPAPQLQSPGNGSGFKNRTQVAFSWTNNINAYYHDIQISDVPSFTNIILEVYLNDPIWAASYFNGLGIRYWRVRYIDGSGTFGPWSQVRNFQIK